MQGREDGIDACIAWKILNGAAGADRDRSGFAFRAGVTNCGVYDAHTLDRRRCVEGKEGDLKKGFVVPVAFHEPDGDGMDAFRSGRGSKS